MEEALDGIPEQLARLVDNVVVVVEDGDDDGPLFGRYEGVPLTERTNWYGRGGVIMPDQVTIFRLPICAACANEDDVVHEVRVTVVHEIAHHFGIDDERLEALGWA